MLDTQYDAPLAHWELGAVPRSWPMGLGAQALALAVGFWGRRRPGFASGGGPLQLIACHCVWNLVLK